jgi:putative alpha-1,2-mannosidase
VEDIAGLIGQYAHGNEPSQHIAYLYSYAGQPWRTQERIQQIIDTLVRQHARGDQRQRGLRADVGLVHLQHAGLLPGEPGRPEYVIGAPACPGRRSTSRRQDLHRAGDRPRPSNYYIQSVTLDGAAYDKTFIRHAGPPQGAASSPSPWAPAPTAAGPPPPTERAVFDEPGERRVRTRRDLAVQGR